MNFSLFKKETLKNIEDGVDYSPKGSIDPLVLDLVNLINKHPDYVTTSSCSGRISTFVHSAVEEAKGVRWLLVKHGVVTSDEVVASLDNVQAADQLVWIKVEPMILHIACNSLEVAKKLHSFCLESGFRESGLTLGQKKTMLAVRTLAFAMETPIAKGKSIIFDRSALDIVVKEANNRILANFNRLEHLMISLKKSWSLPIFQKISSSFTFSRWGHCSSLHDSDIYTSGGYVLDSSTMGAKRGLDSLVMRFQEHFSSSQLPIEDQSMHGSMVTISCSNGHILLRSGGRKGPSSPLEVFRDAYYENNSKEYSRLAVCVEGRVPSPRWGHSLTYLPNSRSLLIFGGRSADQIFADCLWYSIDFDVANSTLKLTEISLDFSNFNQQCNVNLQGSFFHASTLVLCPTIDDSGIAEVVIIHGGLSSIENPVDNDCMIAIVPAKNLIYGVESLSGYFPLSRFGHTLTNIGCRSMVLIGGSSFKNPTSNKVHGNMFLLELVIQSTGLLAYYIYPLNVKSEEPIPCIECRCHHQTIFDSKSMSLYVLGGGVNALGFGGHFCDPLVLKVLYSDSQATKNLEISTEVKTKDPSVTNEVLHPPVILVSKLGVKKIKTFLESKNWFDKQRRIIANQLPLMSFNCITLFSEPSQSIESDTAMLIPITEEALSMIMAAGSTSSTNGSSSMEADLKQFLGDRVYWIRQEPSFSKLTLANTYRKADLYLEGIVASHGMSKSSLQRLPKKYELVGDVLMIPEDSLIGSEWESVMTDSLWQELAHCFQVGRVGRKARVDSGPMRESHVHLLFPRPTTEQENQTGPGSVGWVTVQENGIYFSFDITRVMFCSGNVTERMRMGTMPCRDEVVVDLYAGIGYYTIPFLYHGHAAMVHACEWNPNSILALRENLKKMKLDNRCQIHEGDNSITSKDLQCVADRVSLGLLPSSEKGWLLAVNCLKPTGGVIHVHENVRDDHLAEWTEYCVSKMEQLFQDVSKPMTVTRIWTETVKSYSPRVSHVVLDLVCKPKNQA